MSIRRKLKTVLLPIACKTVLHAVSFRKIPSYTKKIHCDERDIFLMTDTSNNVFRVRAEGKNLFFRECKIHQSIHQYVMEEVLFYYTHLCPELAEDRYFVEKALAERNNFHKFVNMGMINNTSSSAYQFCMGRGGTFVGLQGATPEQEERLKSFVQFIWGDLFSHTLNNGVPKGGYQTYNAVRSIAFRRIAELLNVEYLIPRTEYAEMLIRDGRRLFGTIMEEAPGICMEKSCLEERQAVCSPALQKALNELNLLDVICREKDHRVGNYHVIVENGKAVSVVAFDNDSPSSFSLGGSSFKTYMGCSPWEINGNMNRPYVSREMAEHLMKLDLKDIDEKLKDLLNPLQRLALKCRIKSVKKVLAKTETERWLSEDQWCKETVEEELVGIYGDTYLVKFMQEQAIMSQPWIKNR